MSPDQIVLENVGILGHLDGLAVSAERERAADLNRRNRIVEGRRGDADIGEAESFLLIKVYELAVVRNLCLVEKIGAEQVRMGYRKIAEMVGSGYRKSGRRRTTKVGYRQRLLVMTIGKKEPHRHPALFRVEPVSIGHELLFVEGARNAEGTRALRVEWLGRVDSLRCGNEVAAIGQFELQQCERLWSDVGAVGQHIRTNPGA